MDQLTHVLTPRYASTVLPRHMQGLLAQVMELVKGRTSVPALTTPRASFFTWHKC